MIARIEIFQTEWRAVRGEWHERFRHFATVEVLTSRIKFRIGIDLHARLKAVRPAVVLDVMETIERISRTIGTEIIRSHVGRVKLVVFPAKPDSVSQTAR